ncbi:MAG: hypothetical protein K0R66_943 [Gammaproteobacteria bacterium]|jgi:hypothetical protein|nr:hypothetical protein [Gammaproteobacteria bacterium]
MKEIIEKLRTLPMPVSKNPEQAIEFIRFLAEHKIKEEDCLPISQGSLLEDTGRMLAVFNLIQPSDKDGGINNCLYRRAKNQANQFEQLYLNYLRNSHIAVTGKPGEALATALMAGFGIDIAPNKGQQTSLDPSPTAGL